MDSGCGQSSGESNELLPADCFSADQQRKAQLVKRALERAGWPILLQQLNMVFLRWEKARFATLTNARCRSWFNCISGRRTSLTQPESTSGGGKKHEAGILKQLQGS